MKFELIAIPAALLLCLLAPRLRWLRRLRRTWDLVAAQRGLSVVLVGFTALLACLAYAAVAGLPVPEYHDEFAYVLAADTYARGRLTNPPHPLWQHFESFHILQQPTYMAKYPPGQGLFLAAGTVLFGHPVGGVWLSFVLACAATCWMLQGWLPPRWALLGGLLAALHPRLLPDWGESYWGGAVAMLGGALLFGGLRRLLRQSSRGLAFFLGAGVALLMLSRPFEGLLASLPAAIVFLVWLVARPRPLKRPSSVAVVLPIILVIVATGAFLADGNYRVTGNPVRLPYAVHEEQYVVAPIFIWQAPRPEPAYRHAAMRDFYTTWHLDFYRWHQRDLAGALGTKALWLWRFYLQAVLGVPLVTLVWMVRDAWVRFALATCLLVVSGVLQVCCIFPHYAAPITCLILFLVVEGMRQLRVGGRRWRALKLGVPGLVVVFLTSSVLSAARQLPPDPDAWNLRRADLAGQLQGMGGKHLVVVRYPKDHLTYREWVNNRADIDGAPVVWARDMGGAGNQDLLDYFRDRSIWLLEVSEDSAVLKPYADAP